MLFLDYSSAFNTIRPGKLIRNLPDPNIPTPTYNWILKFLTDRPQALRMGGCTSAELTISPGSPQGCCLSGMMVNVTEPLPQLTKEDIKGIQKEAGGCKDCRFVCLLLKFPSLVFMFRVSLSQSSVLPLGPHSPHVCITNIDDPLHPLRLSSPPPTATAYLPSPPAPPSRRRQRPPTTSEQSAVYACLDPGVSRDDLCARATGLLVRQVQLKRGLAARRCD
uniref:uncharacterized protein LOC105941433 n=1 Tax=Maylandia zebra TaxID=106582 RepID=UPI000D321309|nr:uncharacterized protein LOC105941433 [Maylandia zebra]